MKRILLLAGTALLVVIITTSCGTSKKAIVATPPTPVVTGEVVIDIPLSGAEYQSDTMFWRVVQLGTSPDMSMAKKIALQNARQELAATVQHDLKLVIENYGKNSTTNSEINAQSHYEEMSRTVVNNHRT